jgi:hypothetical protein
MTKLLVVVLGLGVVAALLSPALGSGGSDGRKVLDARSRPIEGARSRMVPRLAPGGPPRGSVRSVVGAALDFCSSRVSSHRSGLPSCG